MAHRFVERLEGGPVVVADGGMGALISSAVRRIRCPEEANLKAPETIVSLHLGFIRAGADLIETNTFGANRRKLAAHYLESETKAINNAAVKLAREAREVSGRDVFVAGSIGPLGDQDVGSEERREIFGEQAAILDGRGVDVMFVETFFDLAELLDAIDGVRSVSSLPVVAMLTFDEEAETLAGVTAREAAERLAPLGLAALGANHGAGIQAALNALAEMEPNGVPLAALPNIGLASLAGSRIVYPHATPDYFAEFAAHARELGARVVGGCCGTTPTEIAAIAAAVKEERRPRAPLEFVERQSVTVQPEQEEETALARKLRQGEWVVSVQLDPPKGANCEALIDVSRELGESGLVDVVDINDNAGARASMSAIIVSAAIEQACAVETVPHVTTRDATIMGLESILLGAHAAGVRNVLAVTGDPPEVGDYPGSRGVYEVDAIGLTELVTRLNTGEDFNGKSIDAPTSFFVGVAVNPTADDMDLELERFRQKLDAGAAFAMTQMIFDLEYLDRLLDLLGGSSPIPLLVGICPLWSYGLALRFHNELPGVIVPEPVQRALEEAGPKAPEVGLALARELYEASREKAAGVYVVAPFRRPLGALDVLG